MKQLQRLTLRVVRALDAAFHRLYGWRWNPLHPERPVPRPYVGKNVLVVGLGPAGYTLAHHLLNEGFGVVAIDGLKIEPLPAAWLEAPIRDVAALREPLEQRVIGGFGGVSEYGITVRWDKSFLALIHLALQTDSTRVVVIGLGEHNQQGQPDLSVGHHDASHHGKDPEKIEQLARYEEKEYRNFAGFLDRLVGTAEAGKLRRQLIDGHDWAPFGVIAAEADEARARPRLEDASSGRGRGRRLSSG